ncbi:MAG: hypothetical protein ACW99Q_18060 [Candidatus Kariarchaeaceae archaeon]
MFFHSIPDTTIGLLLALGAGTFIYVAASDLIPETHRRNQSLRNLGAFIVGVVFIFTLSSKNHRN